MGAEKDSIQLSGKINTEDGMVYVDFSDKQIIEASKKTSYYKNLTETIDNLKKEKHILEKQTMFFSGYTFSLIVLFLVVSSVDSLWNLTITEMSAKGIKTKHKVCVVWKRLLMYLGFMCFTMLLDFFFMTYADLRSPYFMLVFISSLLGTKLYRFFLIQKLRGEDVGDFKRRFVKKIEHGVDDLLDVGGVTGTEDTTDDTFEK